MSQKYNAVKSGVCGRKIQTGYLLDIYRGKLAEQFVAQELWAWQGGPLYYWSRDARSSNAEVDLLAVHDGVVYPIEVKSGKGGSLRSLHLMLEKYPHCPEGWGFYSGEYRELPQQKIRFAPVQPAVSSWEHKPAIKVDLFTGPSLLIDKD